MQSDTTAYNNQIPGIVEARVNAGKYMNAGEHVYTVSMSSLNLGDLNDSLPPNDGVYQKMADNRHAGIEQVISMGWVASINLAVNSRFKTSQVARRWTCPAAPR